MMSTTKKLLFAAALSVFALGAFAQDEGFYAGVKYNFDTEVDITGAGEFDADGFGFGLGYEFGNGFGVNLDYLTGDFDDVDLDELCRSIDKQRGVDAQSSEAPAAKPKRRRTSSPSRCAR